MPGVSNTLYELVRRPQPRSILTFLFAMATLLGGVFAVVSIALVDSDIEWMIPALMGALIVIVVGTMIAVFRRAARDPGGLLLSDVSAREYAALMFISQGDDKSGERAERILAPPVVDSTAVEEQPGQLPPPATAEAEEAGEETD